MADTGNDIANKQATSNDIHEEVHVYEDEINPIDYFLVLWKHKWLIFLCSVLPALIIGSYLYFLPRSYELTYTYDVRDYARDGVEDETRDYIRDDVSKWNLDAKNFNVLLSRFYSEENLNRIIGELQKNKLEEYARQVRNFRTDASKKLIEFEVSPPFINLSKLKVTNPDNVEKLRDMKAFLLNMTIIGKSKEDLSKIALAIKSNFEKVTPLYMIQEQLLANIREYNSRRADIENTRFSSGLALKNNAAILAGLKKIAATIPDKERGDAVFQFDVGRQSQYLPLSYRIQSVELKITALQAEKNAVAAKYQYYKDLSSLNARMIAELGDKLSSGQDYTINLFKSFLAGLIGETEKQELKDYLAS
ncbi:hypothetical protein KA005_75085, partial [bacterium]|nr:hypothetical protein [bacterium]